MTTKRPMLTRKMLGSWGYWNAEAVERAFAIAPALSPQEVAVADAIPLDDRLWMLCQMLARRDEAAARAVAIEAARHASILAGDQDNQALHQALVDRLQRAEKLTGRARLRERKRVSAESWNAEWDARWAPAWTALRAATWTTAWIAAKVATQSAAPLEAAIKRVAACLEKAAA